MNVGTLHVRVTFVGPSLAIKDNSHAHSVIPAILKRGYYCPQVNVSTLPTRVASAGPSLDSKDHSHEHIVILSILKRGYCHPQINVKPSSLSSIIDVSLIITPHFLGGSILSTCSPFVRGGFIVLTCSYFSRIVHIF